VEKFDENISQDLTPEFETSGQLKIRALDVLRKRLFTRASILIQRSGKAGNNGYRRSGESTHKKTAAMHLDAGRGGSTQVLFEQL